MSPQTTHDSAVSLPTSDMNDAEKKDVHVETASIRPTDSSDAELGESSQDEDDKLVHWDGPNDPQNPMNWTSFRKWMTIALISISSYNV